MRKLSFLVSMLLLLVASVVPTFAQDEGGTIVDIASETDSLSSLVAAVEAADPAVAETLSGEGPYTVFAPTNAAFENLAGFLGMSLEDILAQQELLTQVLLYHVVEGEVFAEDVVALDGEAAPTLLDGAFIGITVDEDTVVLNDVVEVVQTDIDASNGVVHVINDVLLPQVVLDQLAGMDAEATEEPMMEATEEPMAEMTEEPMMAAPATVRVAHLSPDTPAVDVYVNGEVALAGIEYGIITAWVPLDAGTYEIAVAPAETSIEDAAIGPAEFDLPAGAFITIAAVGSLEAETLAPAVIVENYAPLDEEQARVGVFHAIEGAPAVDVIVNGDTELIGDLAFPGTVFDEDDNPNDGFFELVVPPGTYNDLVVTVADDAETVLLDLSGAEFVDGSYTFVAAIGTPEEPSVAINVTAPEVAATLRADDEMMDMEMEATEEPMMEATEEAMAPPAQESIVDVVSTNEGFSTLLAAVENADPVILETLLGEGPYTVFAPTNAAFENLLSTLDMSAEDLLAETDLLTQVLAYHVVEGEFFAEDVVALDGEAAPTLLEDALVGITITEDGGVVLNDVATVTRADIDVTNGVVHVIDEVLLPQVVVDALGM